MVLACRCGGGLGLGEARSSHGYGQGGASPVPVLKLPERGREMFAQVLIGEGLCTRAKAEALLRSIGALLPSAPAPAPAPAPPPPPHPPLADRAARPITLQI
jgi:hypothetical protein